MKILFPATFWLLILVPHLCTADDSEYSLRPLKYNNPGLIVDLGVGLWAYPMPVDYDNDGDLDLLVACPDKPSNGIYFFENPSADPEESLPVFKPGVRVGQAGHSMAISRRGSEAVILQQNRMFVRDSNTGRFDFGQPNRIALPAKPVPSAKQRMRANTWKLVDFDGDGDHDIVAGVGEWSDLGWDHAYDKVGQWKNGPLHGYVYVTTNQGTDEVPQYSASPFRVQTNQGDVDVYGWPSPSFADFDGDGDLDLLCGEFLDGFTYFQNHGTRTKPKYSTGIRLQNTGGQRLTMDLQMITPTAIDWDADGDQDLIVGDEDGRVAFVQNVRTDIDGVPVFADPVYLSQQADTLKFGALATPFACDWDGDGDDDIVCGNTAGQIGMFENLGLGKGGLPKWSSARLLEVRTTSGLAKPFRVMAGTNGSIQGPCEAKWGYTTLSVVDWDADGDLDIVYNSILGKLGLLIRNNETLVETPFDTGCQELPPKWFWNQNRTASTLTQWRTTPVALKFDDNESVDLVMLDQEGFLTLRSGGGKAQRVFVHPSGQPIQLNSGTCGRSGRVKLAVCDWDSDGRQDVLVNSENAIWYRNVATIEGKTVLKKLGNLAQRNVAGHTSSPAVCDFDSDSVPDLLVGSENGRIYHIRHDQCVKFDSSDTGASFAGQTQWSVENQTEQLKFPGWVSEEFVFEKAPFAQCHASTVCETSRGLVAAWFGGTKEGQDDVGIWSSYHDGLKWNGPHRVADGVQHSSLRYPCWNPVLYQTPGDGPTLLFFKVGPSPREWWGEMMVSYDRGRSFRDRRRLPEGIDGPVRCKPLLLNDGQTLLCGSSTEYDGWRVHFESVQLKNERPESTWNRIGPINDGSTFNAIQPTFLNHADGRIQVLCRTKENVIASSFSADEGKSWSRLTAIDLPNPNSGIEAVTLSDGRHLLVYNHLAAGATGWGRRGLLNLAISSDGLSWKSVGILDQKKGAEFSYPAVIQTADEAVHITYTHNRTRIKHVTLNPAELVPTSDSEVLPVSP